ncbi:MAG: hypothetical protein RL011_38 [Pseudomonadota bacterium]|jgi:hypothetical protein
MKKISPLMCMLFIQLLGFASVSLGEEGGSVAQEFTQERSRWVCVANIKRGSVYGHGSTMEEARDSVLRRCFPNSLCLANMTCRER